MVATYEQTKKGFSYFYKKKRQVQDDGIHAKPFSLYITDSVIAFNSVWLTNCNLS